MNERLLYTAIFAAVLILSILAVRNYYRRQTKKTLQYILEILDRAAARNLQAGIYDESMPAAIIERLNRVLQISDIHQQNAEKERDTVKSLISDISHQVRTPLTNIMLYTGLLKEMDLGSEAGILIRKLQKQSDKLDFFMKELVKSSYAEQEMISIHPEPVPVFEIIRTACQTAELAAMKKGIRIQQTPSPPPPGFFRRIPLPR